jgi:hypothetical protein
MIIKSFSDGISPEATKTGWISAEDDHTRRHTAIRSCVDGFLEYELDGKKGILLAFRDNTPPAANSVWVPGGEWKRGIADPVEALRIKIKAETNLELRDIEYLGMASMFWKDSPYNTEELKKEREKRNLGEGIHDLGHAFFAKASGELKLKTMTPPVIIVTRENFDEVMEKHKVHDYIKTFVWEALKKVN